MTRRTLLVALLLLALPACTTITKVGPGQVTVKDLSMMLEGPWNKFDSSAVVLFQAPGATEIWTREGFTLDVLAFYVGISDGEAIGKSLPRKSTKMPVFRVKMAPHEILEAFETVVTQDGSVFKVSRLEPARFAGGEGFRFEYELRRKGDSLLFNGVGYGTIANKKLYLIAYSAPHTYFFGKLVPGLESAVRSASIKR